MKENKLLLNLLLELRKKLSNDKEFGGSVGILIASLDKKYKEEEKDLIKCCLCENTIEINPITKWAFGNNPDPLGKNEDDRCCDACNESRVLPARIGRMMGDGIVKMNQSKSSKK